VSEGAVLHGAHDGWSFFFGKKIVEELSMGLGFRVQHHDN
jgi:hypothetical protein